MRIVRGSGVDDEWIPAFAGMTEGGGNDGWRRE